MSAGHSYTASSRLCPERSRCRNPDPFWFHRCPPSDPGSVAFSSVTLRRTPGRMAPGQPSGISSGVLFQAPGEKTLYLTGDTIWYDAQPKLYPPISPMSSSQTPEPPHCSTVGASSWTQVTCWPCITPSQSPDYRHTPGQCSPQSLYTSYITGAAGTGRTIPRHQYSGRWRNTDILI